MSVSRNSSKNQVEMEKFSGENPAVTPEKRRITKVAPFILGQIFATKYAATGTAGKLPSSKAQI